MLIRQLDPHLYRDFCARLHRSAQLTPFCTYYTWTLFSAGREYALQIVPEAENTLVLLQALFIDRYSQGEDFTQITETEKLSPLLDLALAACNAPPPV